MEFNKVRDNSLAGRKQPCEHCLESWIITHHPKHLDPLRSVVEGILSLIWLMAKYLKAMLPCKAMACTAVALGCRILMTCVQLVHMQLLGHSATMHAKLHTAQILTHLSVETYFTVCAGEAIAKDLSSGQCILKHLFRIISISNPRSHSEYMLMLYDREIANRSMQWQHSSVESVMGPWLCSKFPVSASSLHYSVLLLCIHSIKLANN